VYQFVRYYGINYEIDQKQGWFIFVFYFSSSTFHDFVVTNGILIPQPHGQSLTLIFISFLNNTKNIRMTARRQDFVWHLTCFFLSFLAIELHNPGGKSACYSLSPVPQFFLRNLGVAVRSIRRISGVEFTWNAPWYFYTPYNSSCSSRWHARFLSKSCVV
jgi:hypothetical protein